MKEPKNALIKQYKKLFDMDDVALSFHDEAVEAIAQKAFERQTGARGLRSIMESVMMDTMYTIPSDESIKECVITKEAVEGTSAPIVVRKGEKKSASRKAN
jgi:ATP-dependent Clp protease ATP-binding subunit ClpX